MSKDYGNHFYGSYYSFKEFYDKSDFKISDGLNIKDKKILSLGCGTCDDINYLFKENEVWGIDSSEAALKIAGLLGAKTKISDLNDKVDFPDRFFDIVICKDVLEHLIKPDQLLKEIYRILKDDGFLIINVPNHFYWYFRLRILFGSNLIWKTFFHDHTKYFEEWNYMHIRFFTFKGLLKLLNHIGFKIQKCYWDFGMLGHYADPERFSKQFRIRLFESKEGIPCWKKLLIIKIFYPFYLILNFIFPKKLRSMIVALNPALLSASFYFKCTKNINSNQIKDKP